MVQMALENLADYGIAKNLIQPADKTYVINLFLDILKIPAFEPTKPKTEQSLEEILIVLLDDAVARGVIEDSIVYKDLLDTKLMGAMTPFPSTIHQKFQELYNENPEKATDWYYELSCNTDYIRKYRIAKDVSWKANTKYGVLDITINLSKPEKDPKAIAAAKNAPKSELPYPKCMLCRENEGSCGTVTLPARQNHRIIPITIDEKDWFFQYSPYVYYNEHCIVFNGEHTPMKIDRSTFAKMMDFIKIFPHYFVGSNADLPIVGGSILTHDHFQGGHYTFAMETAEPYAHYSVKKYEDVKVCIVDWPMSVIRATHEDSDRLIEFADHLLTFWKKYTNDDAFVFSHTGEEPHNTITPIARRVGDKFQMDLVLRNNITTELHPMGVFHPHEELHHIKKENIGLIEVMGLAVLPARLKEEMAILKDAILNHDNLEENDKIAKHASWVRQFIDKYDAVNDGNIQDILNAEIGIVFEKVLSCAGVFKVDEPYFDIFMNDFGAKKL